MAEPHAVLNTLTEPEAAAALRRACGAERWVRRMLARRPYTSTLELYALAEAEWQACGAEDYLEAFNHHPRIGEDMAALRRRFQSTASLSSREQSGVADADEATLHALSEANAAYFERHGFIFIICASGKTAAEMLGALRLRLGNDPATELEVAAAEHAKITRLRLEGLGLHGPGSDGAHTASGVPGP